MSEFQGILGEGLRFLENLAQNNNRDWFEAHKADYTNHLLEPAQALVAALGARLQDISPNIRFDVRTNGSGSLMRIYRDTRFSADKTPYKTNITMSFWEGDGKKNESPGFGLRFDASGGGLLAGMHGFPKPMLAAYRQAVVDDTLGPALVAAVEKVTAAGDYAIGGEHYKRVPRGFDADHKRADWLRYAALYASTSSLPADVITSHALVETCYQHFAAMAPIQQWLVKIQATH